MKKCMFCAEEIQNEAIVCKHCGRDNPLPPPNPSTGKLEEAVHPYLSAGYEIANMSDTSATLTMPKRLSRVAFLLIFNPLILVFYLIYYWLTKSKGYSVLFRLLSNGEVVVSGYTLDHCCPK